MTRSSLVIGREQNLLFFGLQSGLQSRDRVSSPMSSALRGTSNLA
jgi:hypothetical protein